ncbi:hypothetical protein EDB80DRAFT_688466 [Ilyonectria destructans]|nr:hypothetical protein EDB80DRAFT_688466 [Ilyonectria destructans]
MEETSSSVHTFESTVAPDMASIENISASHRKWVRIMNKVDALSDCEDSGTNETDGETSNEGQLPNDQGNFEEVCEAEGWGYEDACTILMWEIMLNFRDHARSNTIDENDQITRLYGEVHTIIYNHFNGPEQAESIVHRVKNTLLQATIDRRDKRLVSTQQIKDAIPTRVEILATRFISPFSKISGSIAGYLGALRCSYYLDIQPRR